MIRRPPGSTRTTHSFPTRRSSDLRSLLKSLAIVATAFLAGCQTLVPKGPPPVETTAPPPETRPPVEQGIPTDTERNRVALLGIGREDRKSTRLNSSH